jgi:hypothetical protein
MGLGQGMDMSELPFIPSEPYEGFDRDIIEWYRAKQASRDLIEQCPACGQPILFIYPSENDLNTAQIHYLRRCQCSITEEWWQAALKRVVERWLSQRPH